MPAQVQVLPSVAPARLPPVPEAKYTGGTGIVAASVMVGPPLMPGGFCTMLIESETLCQVVPPWSGQSYAVSKQNED